LNKAVEVLQLTYDKLYAEVGNLERRVTEAQSAHDTARMRYAECRDKLHQVAAALEALEGLEDDG
jgi:predicted  nucleic acid-binding Zn-ribbon protein